MKSRFNRSHPIASSLLLSLSFFSRSLRSDFISLEKISTRVVTFKLLLGRKGEWNHLPDRVKISVGKILPVSAAFILPPTEG